MLSRWMAGLLVVAIVLAGCTDPNAPNAPRLEIVDPWARTADMSAGAATSAAYMIIKNTGKVDDKLIGASSDVSEFVELHTTEERNGVMMMAPVKQMNVPAFGQAELKPGGLHVMFIKLKRSLAEGEKLTVTLQFEKSGEMKLEIPVRP